MGEASEMLTERGGAGQASCLRMITGKGWGRPVCVHLASLVPEELTVPAVWLPPLRWSGEETGKRTGKPSAAGARGGCACSFCFGNAAT